MIKEHNAQLTSKKTITDWQQLNKEWEKTCEPQKQFCKKHGVPYAKFVYWRSKLVQAQNYNDSTPTFKAIKIAESDLPPITSPPIIKVSLPGNIVITIPTEINDKTLTIFLQSLRGLCHA